MIFERFLKTQQVFVLWSDKGASAVLNYHVASFLQKMHCVAPKQGINK
jgi:hypothetical protein